MYRRTLWTRHHCPSRTESRRERTAATSKIVVVEGLPGRRLENLERWVERESGDVGGLAGERTDAGAFFAHNGTMTETNEVRTLRVDRRREVTGRFLR